MCLSVIVKPQKWDKLGPLGVVVPWKKKRKIYALLSLRCMKISQWCNFIVKDQEKKWQKERPQYSSTKFAATVEKQPRAVPSVLV
jgi:hypothetical protein